MAKNVLPVDFQDDILAESMNGRRKYQMITNSDGTVSFVDVTEYTQVGSNFGQAQVNATNEAVNESADKNKIIDDKDDLVANSQAGMMAGALAVKAIREELTQNMSAKFITLSGSKTFESLAVLPDYTNVAATELITVPEGYTIISVLYNVGGPKYNRASSLPRGTGIGVKVTESGEVTVSGTFLLMRTS